jgi:hypothetical protein
MSLPKQLYDSYKQLRNCTLVRDKQVDEKSLLEFQTLLNAAQPLPADTTTCNYRDLVRMMYLSNKIGFLRYAGNSRNRVNALVLWTESKEIVRYFGLMGLVHLSWNVEAQAYMASKHIQRTQHATQHAPQTDQLDNGTPREIRQYYTNDSHPENNSVKKPARKAWADTK